MSASIYARQLQERQHVLLDQLITRLLPVKKGEENYGLAWDFCTGNLNPKFHSYREADTRDVARLFEGLEARMEQHSQLAKAARMCQLRQQLAALSLPGAGGDTAASTLLLLYGLSGQPLLSTLPTSPQAASRQGEGQLELPGSADAFPCDGSSSEECDSSDYGSTGGGSEEELSDWEDESGEGKAGQQGAWVEAGAPAPGPAAGADPQDPSTAQASGIRGSQDGSQVEQGPGPPLAAPAPQPPRGPPQPAAGSGGTPPGSPPWGPLGTLGCLPSPPDAPLSSASQAGLGPGQLQPPGPAVAQAGDLVGRLGQERLQHTPWALRGRQLCVTEAFLVHQVLNLLLGHSSSVFSPLQQGARAMLQAAKQQLLVLQQPLVALQQDNLAASSSSSSSRVGGCTLLQLWALCQVPLRRVTTLATAVGSALAAQAAATPPPDTQSRLAHPNVAAQGRLAAGAASAAASSALLDRLGAVVQEAEALGNSPAGVAAQQQLLHLSLTALGPCLASLQAWLWGQADTSLTGKSLRVLKSTEEELASMHKLGAASLLAATPGLQLLASFHAPPPRTQPAAAPPTAPTPSTPPENAGSAMRAVKAWVGRASSAAASAAAAAPQGAAWPLPPEGPPPPDPPPLTLPDGQACKAKPGPGPLLQWADLIPPPPPPPPPPPAVAAGAAADRADQSAASAQGCKAARLRMERPGCLLLPPPASPPPSPPSQALAPGPDPTPPSTPPGLPPPLPCPTSWSGPLSPSGQPLPPSSSFYALMAAAGAGCGGLVGSALTQATGGAGSGAAAPQLPPAHTSSREGAGAGWGRAGAAVRAGGEGSGSEDGAAPGASIALGALGAAGEGRGPSPPAPAPAAPAAASAAAPAPAPAAPAAASAAASAAAAAPAASAHPALEPGSESVTDKLSVLGVTQPWSHSGVEDCPESMTLVQWAARLQLTMHPACSLSSHSMTQPPGPPPLLPSSPSPDPTAWPKAVDRQDQVQRPMDRQATVGAGCGLLGACAAQPAELQAVQAALLPPLLLPPPPLAARGAAAAVEQGRGVGGGGPGRGLDQLGWLLRGQWTEVPPLQLLLEQCVMVPLHIQVEEVGHQLLGCLLSSWGLVAELTALRNLYLLASPHAQPPPLLTSPGAGCEAQTWAERLIRALLQGRSLLEHHEYELEVSLQEAAAEAEAGQEDSRLPPATSLSVALDRERMQAVRAKAVEAVEAGGGSRPRGLVSVAELEGLAVVYQPSWLVSMIGGREAVSSYNNALTLQLQIRLARSAVESARLRSWRWWRHQAQLGSRLAAAASSSSSLLAPSPSPSPSLSQPGTSSLRPAGLSASLLQQHQQQVLGLGQAARPRARDGARGQAAAPGLLGEASGGAGVQLPGAAGQLEGRREELALQEMSHFVNNLHQFVVDRLLYTAWTQLEKDLDECRSLDQVVSHHTAFLALLDRQAGKGGAGGAAGTWKHLMSAIIKVLDQVVRFCSAHHMTVFQMRAAEAAQHIVDGRRQMQAAIGEFRRLHRYLTAFLRNKTIKIGGAEAELEAFVMRINYNDYYRD
ncbi:hypothetical protein QJQ45_009919 [Haematococcus lacustris]|nr:hypothetical protein QJQ45_009919 [Haematococcus lacustris]